MAGWDLEILYDTRDRGCNKTYRQEEEEEEEEEGT
jgi:hypothetical protein